MKRERDLQTENPKHAFVPIFKRQIVTGWAKISFDHFDYVSKYKWHISGYNYVTTNIDGKSCTLHKFIMCTIMTHCVKNGQLIDHINRDKLDNRIENLRVVSYTQNARNRSKSATSSSVYYNVIVEKQNQFSVVIQIDGVSVRVGSYMTEIRAAEMRDVYLLKRFTDFEASGFNLNFPERKTELMSMTVANDFAVRKKPKQLSYIGVSKVQNNVHPFAARVRIGKKTHNIGYYCTEIEAATAYDGFIIHRKLNRKLNFDHPGYVPELKIPHNTQLIANDDSKIGLVVGTDVVVVDKSDYDKIKYGSISKKTVRGSYTSFHLRFPKSKRYSLARFLCDVTDPSLVVDHLDSDTKNNSKSNLRVCTPAENHEGRKKIKTATSVFYGVQKAKTMFKTIVTHKAKSYTVYFKKEEDAAIANDVYILLHLPNTKKRKNFTYWNAENLESERVRLNCLIRNETKKL